MRLKLAAVLLASAVSVIAAEIPRQSPEYVISLPNGSQELLSKHKGKVVIMEFLLTTCPHCQKSAALLSKLQREYGPKIQVFGVAINPNPDIAGFTQQYATAFPVGSGTRETALGYLQQSIMASNFYVPQMVFLDRKGVIRAQYGGTDPFLGDNQEANMRGMIDKLLAEGGAKVPAAAKTKPASKKAS